VLDKELQESLHGVVAGRRLLSAKWIETREPGFFSTNEMLKPFFTYILRCADGSYYTGSTDELEKRIAEHQNGQGCTWTRKRLPVEFVWRQEFATREEAKAAENQIKGWSRAKKEALIAGRFDIVSKLASRGAEGRALRDARKRAPQMG
jgi:tRNA/rRNA methyltransferase